jgi:1-phosphofructokinase
VTEESESSVESTADVDVCVFAPTPLLTVTVEKEANDEPRMHLHVGGQGAWIARMVRTLGATPHVCGAFGGETGTVARFLGELEGFNVRGVDIAGWNGAYVHDRRSGERVELASAPSAALTRHELDDLYSTTLGAALDSGACIIAGAHDEGVVGHDTFHRLAADVGNSEVPVIVDLSGEPLAAVLDAAPTTIKVSDDELAAGGWLKKRSVDGVVNAIARLQKEGAVNVVVSRRSKPTIASMDGVLYLVKAPPVEIVDSRGGGDAMTAALAVAAARHLSGENALRLAAAAAVATMSRHGLGTGRRELIAASEPRVEIREMS